MDIMICQTIKRLRLTNHVSQDTLAKSLGISTQAVSKWENQKALPDIYLLLKIASFFQVSIETLFSGQEERPGAIADSLENEISVNKTGWNNISDENWNGTYLPSWGPYTPDENSLQLLGSLTGKNVLEIACGSGESLAWCALQKPRELWGIDLSESQIMKAKTFLKENHVEANLWISPMEVNPGIPEYYFDCVYSVYGLGWSQNLEQSIMRISRYLKSGGVFVFSWDNPLLPCIRHKDRGYVIDKSYVKEQKRMQLLREKEVELMDWKLSSYINCMARYGLHIEQLIEDSAGMNNEAPYTEKYYSSHKAQYLNHSIIIKARKM